ncbi:hypothetical protein RJ639_027876 [Escallonia herrerae]|uniref:Branched-chain amino acid aminotransferase n=1 Tax=Escallonia herrerae TaxID=1293975 RepID=A0AA88X6J9_9ASTE|nr:hypothetical protein RJ639_027876 [Escallonia herrerae]
MIQRSAYRIRHLVKSSILGSSKFKQGDLTYLPTCFLGVVSNGGDAEYADVDWNNLGFGLMPADYTYAAKCSVGESFVEGKVLPYGNIELSPFAGVLNYGQGVIEGVKICRGENGGILLFRPEQNAIQMQVGAERMCMPSPSVELFVDALKQTALANRRWTPPPGKGWLYIRPQLIESGPIHGVAPSPECTFLLYASPFGNNYFKVEERLILVEELMDVDEVFCTGTAISFAPVESITYQDKRVEYDMCAKQVSGELLAKLAGIQRGLIEDTWGWVAKID